MHTATRLVFAIVLLSSHTLAEPAPTTDEALAWRVELALGQLPGTGCPDLRARVHGHTVILTGSVPGSATHARTLLAVDLVDGVDLVRDETSTDPLCAVSAIALRTPETLVARARAALAGLRQVDGRPLVVGWLGHRLVLAGEVFRYADARRALDAVRTATGSTGLRCELRIREATVRATASPPR